MLTFLQDFLAHWAGFLGPYRVCVRVPIGGVPPGDEWVHMTFGAFTEAQGLRLLHNMGYPGTLTRSGKLVALKN